MYQEAIYNQQLKAAWEAELTYQATSLAVTSALASMFSGSEIPAKLGAYESTEKTRHTISKQSASSSGIVHFIEGAPDITNIFGGF